MLVTMENNKEHIARYLEQFAESVRTGKFEISSTLLREFQDSGRILSEITIEFFDTSGARGQEP